MENPLLDLDQVLADDFLDGLEALPLPELRSRKARCDEVEVALSYLRRLVQGRLDIVHAELHRRSVGDEADAGDLSGLVSQLPGILSGDASPGDGGRLPASIGAHVNLRLLTADLDRIMDADKVAVLPDMDDAEVGALADALADLERTVSAQRRSVHQCLDALQGELVRRYRSGEASVDALLR